MKMRIKMKQVQVAFGDGDGDGDEVVVVADVAVVVSNFAGPNKCRYKSRWNSNRAVSKQTSPAKHSPGSDKWQTGADWQPSCKLQLASCSSPSSWPARFLTGCLAALLII